MHSSTLHKKLGESSCDFFSLFFSENMTNFDYLFILDFIKGVFVLKGKS